MCQDKIRPIPVLITLFIFFIYNWKSRFQSSFRWLCYEWFTVIIILFDSRKKRGRRRWKYMLMDCIYMYIVEFVRLGYPRLRIFFNIKVSERPKEHGQLYNVEIL